MGRLIDESELIDIIQGSDEITNYQKDECITCIRACNTAYDPDKVVEQLENYLFEKYCVEGDIEIDKIVKAGGADAKANP